MSQDKELEFELIDDSTEVEIDETSLDNNREQEDDEENTSSTKNKNNSNFKKLSKNYKEAKKELEELRAKLSMQEKPLEDKVEQKTDILSQNDELQKLKIDIFTTKIPESEEYISEIMETMQEYNIPMEKAWKIVKSDLPETSKSSDYFDISNRNIKPRKKLEDLTPDEALQLKRRGETEKFNKWADSQMKNIRGK